MIAANAHGWTLKRMPAIDLTVLRIAAFELFHRPDVPVAVVLDEAVELAKRFSTDDSGRFVNGVLAVDRPPRPPRLTAHGVRPTRRRPLASVPPVKREVDLGDGLAAPADGMLDDDLLDLDEAADDARATSTATSRWATSRPATTVTATGDPGPDRRTRLVDWGRDLPRRAWQAHPAAWLTFVGACCSPSCSARSACKRQNTFGTWSFDMGIYDQGFWLVSRGGQTFMTVRGLDFWGQHLNLIAYAFVPFYWLGAGPNFLFVAQAAVLGVRRGADLPHRQGPLQDAVDGPRLRRRLPDVRADPVDQLGQLPPRGAGHHPAPVRLVVRHAPAVDGRCSSPW